jgi:precorrin-6Y C5,15-methyltransferase (decarboxylating)
MDPVAAVMQGKPAFFLTGGDLTPDTLCRQLTEADLGDLQVAVGEKLGYSDARLIRGTASELAEKNYDPLSVMLVEKAPAPEITARGSGLADDLFLRGKVPMTKRDVRASILARLSPAPGEILWDVGAGTGSVSVEMAQAASMGQVYAVEINLEGVELIGKNRTRFGVWNLHVVEGMAPAALADLPAPDAVFLGGTKGSMLPSIECALGKNPRVRFCVTGILMETAMEAIQILTAKGMEVNVTQIQSSEGEPVGGKHMMMANNPVFVISGSWTEGGAHA